MTKLGHEVPTDIGELLYALGCCDRNFMENSPEHRFRNLIRGKDETLGHFLKRCNIYFDEIQYPRLDKIKRIRQIKAQFLRGANIPKDIKEKLRPYNDLYELITVCKNLLSRRRYGLHYGKPSKTRHWGKKFKNEYELKSNNQSPKGGNRVYQAPCGSLVVPLMDIKFPIENIIHEKN